MGASRRSAILATLLAALLLLGAAPPAAGVRLNAGNVAVPTAVSGARIVVTYRDAASAARGGAGVADVRLVSEEAALHMRVFRVTEGRESRAMRALAAQSGVATIESEVKVKSTATPNDPLWRANVSWAHDRVGLRQAWDQTTGSNKVSIAILDSGLEWHTEFHQRIAAGWDFVENDNRANDPRGHGSMSAGAAAARGNNKVGLAGACWTCRIMPVRVLDRHGTGYAAWVIRGIIWATDNGADVISMSFGGFQPSAAMAAAVTYARQRGVVVLGSAGNDGESAPFYPASFPGVIGVAASDVNNKIYRWSNRGRWFELAAPGCFHTTTAQRGYTSFCGTSASTPLVAGIVGLMRSVRPDLPGYMIERALLGSATKVSYVTHGIPNAARAINVARTMKAPAPPRPANTTFAWVEKGGVVTIEAERANARVGRSTIDWINASVKTGFAGSGYVAAWADKGLSMSTNYAATSAELKYHVHFTRPGIYSVWLRTWVPDGGGDSVHVGVEGKMLKATDKIFTHYHGRWGWTRSTMDGTVAKIAITKPGVHTINVWAREDGFRFDRIVLSIGPRPVGLGPTESATVGIPAR